MESTKTSSVGLTLGALIGLITAPLAIPSAALAQTAVGTSSDATIGTAPAEHPVGIVLCALNPVATVAQTTEGVTTGMPEPAAGINVAFINRGGTAADSVAFLVSYNGEQHRIVDRGHFSPGTTINHRFLTFAGDPVIDGALASCAVASIHFEGATI